MGIKLTNNANGTLATAISSTDTTIVLAGGSHAKFPVIAANSGDWAPATLVDADGNREIVKVTARSDAQLTVQRAQEGTAARAWPAGTRIDVRLTAGVVGALAPLDSPTFTNNPKAPTPAVGDNSTRIATTAFVAAAIVAEYQRITGSAPAALDTLYELVAAINNDPNFATTVFSQIATKLAKTGDTMTGPLTVDFTNPYVLFAGDNRSWYWQAVEAGTYFRLVDQTAGVEAFRVGVDGSIWCRQLGDISTRIEQRAAAYAALTLGVGQVWQDVAASRAVNTSYQNATGKPISVSVRSNNNTNNGAVNYFQVSVDNASWVNIGWTPPDDGINGFPVLISQGPFIVPPAHYYRYNTNISASISEWKELR